MWGRGGERGSHKLRIPDHPPPCPSPTRGEGRCGARALRHLPCVRCSPNITADKNREAAVMIVKEFDVTPSTMRKEDPTWRFALGASPVTDGQVVRIATDDGIEGFGYASATPHMGSIQNTLAAELALFRPLVVGRDPRNIEAILTALD